MADKTENGGKPLDRLPPTVRYGVIYRNPRRWQWIVWSIVLGVMGFLFYAKVLTSCGCGRTADAQVARAKADITSLKTALEQFEIDTGRYPTSDEGLEALASNPGGLPKWTHPYIETVPLDPWHHPYVYRQPGTDDRDYDLISAGPDGIPDTMDDVKP